ncbi:nitronate monooxygenase [Ruegeria pomeroyi]|uniref:Nitronate monooxygenase n=1 Tax=Ruegeria pomeroyi TaxID=89184 RepID=A0A9Q3ZND8_9RHOB|nr:nitronate monooxygenase [Ruegeria pomeroyi]MCE8520848.1 nitronate monooxygenase [Ruegeria pomeroyi]MCE8537916.1 nitronate monooxygenase [Ruegeria pomeroyi]
MIRWNTPLTRRFGLRLPIIAGGLQWLADADYVIAAAQSGIMGFITAASHAEFDDLRAEIARAREGCAGKPFGVNVSMLPKLVPGEKTEDIFRLIADEGVEVIETSGRNPEPYMPLLKDLGLTIIHKVPAVRYAVKAEAVGVDIVSIVGAECGGHPGMDMIGSFVNAAMAGRDLKIPFLIGGGVGHGSQLVAALAMGASGVVMGTRLLVSEELNAHRDYKQALVDATERDTMLTMSSVRNTVRTLANETTLEVSKLEREKPDVTIGDLLPLVSGRIGRDAYATGDVSRGLLSAGHSLGLTDKIEPMADIIARIEAEAAASIARLEGKVFEEVAA